MAASFALKSHKLLFGDNPFLCKSHVSLSLYFSTSAGNTKEPTLLNIPPTCDSFIEKYHFSPQTASGIASVSAGMKNPQNSDSVLSFLKESGFSNKQLEKVVRLRPCLVSFCLEKNIKPKIKIFQDLGFSAGEIAEIVTNVPNILVSSAINRINPSLSVLKGLLGSNAQVSKLLRKPASAGLFRVDLEKTMLPNVGFLKSCGVQMVQINSLLFTFPMFFTLDPENMKRFVDKVDEMGVERSSKLFIYAVRAVSSMSEETWVLKLKTFKDFGFSEEEILRVFRSNPMLLAASGQKIKKVKEILLETGKYDMSHIVRYPISLTLSAEKRYTPRVQVLKVLEKRSLIKKWPGLPTLASMTDEKFFKKFVAPNINEVGEGFIVETAVSCKRETEIRPE